MAFSQPAMLPFPIGSTAGFTATTDGNELEGLEFEIPDLNYSNTPPTVWSYHATGGNCVPYKRIRVVRNVSGITLLPRYLVQFQTTNYGRRIIGYTNTTAGEGYPVDEFISATLGVPNNDLFYITVEGCAECLASTLGDDGNVITQGTSILVGVTAAASTFSTSAGRVAAMATTGATNVLLVQALNKVGVGLTTKTTGNTNKATDGIVLCHVKKW